VRVMNLRAGDGVSAIAKVVSSRGTDAEGATDELSLDEIVNEPGAEFGASADGLSSNGAG
jgi:DNA gyrase subunit A